MSNATLNDIRRYTIIGILIGASLLIALPAGETSSTVLDQSNEANSLQTGNFTVIIPNGGFNAPVHGVAFNPTFSSIPQVLWRLDYSTLASSQNCGYFPSEPSWTIQAPGNTASIWATMPSALTEIYGNTNTRIMVDGTGFLVGTLTVNVITAGSANANLQVQWSQNQATWFPLFDNLSIASTGIKQLASTFPTSFAGIGTIFLRVMGIGGNGIASPQFGIIQILLIESGLVTGFASAYITSGSLFPFGFTLQVQSNAGPCIADEPVTVFWVAYLPT